MSRLSLIVLVLSVGLLIALRPAAHETSGTPELGNCYSDVQDYSMPTICQ